MSLNFCDLLVIGSDLSGIIAATLLAKRGMSVLVLDDEDEEEPFPNIITGLNSRSFKSLVGKLMIPDSKLQIVQENKVSCQIIFPRHRLDFSGSRSDLFKEIDREFPQEKGLLEDLFAEVDHLRENYLDDLLAFFPVIGPKEKKRFVSWFQGFPDEKLLATWNRLSPTVRCFLQAQIRFLSRGLSFEPPVLQLLIFLGPEAGASFSIRGGPRELKKLFYDKLDYFGGMVHPLGEDPFQILNKRKEVRAIQLHRYNFPTRCRFLLGNTNVQSLYAAFPSSFLGSFFDRTRQKIASLKPAEQHALVQYHIARDVLPEPMQENVVMVSDPHAPLEGGNYLEVNLSQLPKGDDFDTLMTVSYIGHEGMTEKIHEEIEQKLRWLIPFGDAQMKRVFPSPPVPTVPQETQELFPENGNGSLLFEKMMRKRISYSPSFFFPPVPSRFKNLMVLGPNVLDWIGMEGKMLSALKAVEMIWTQELKIRNP